MGRKSKLTEDQWAEIKARVLGGESARSLADEYGVSETAIRKKISSQVSEIKSVANQLATAQTALAKLPISSQISAQTLAQRMMSISSHLASAADYGAATSHRLSALAHAEVSKIDDANPLSSGESLRGIAALTSLANESGKIAINLMSANKDKSFDVPDRPTMTLDEFYGGTTAQSGAA